MSAKPILNSIVIAAEIPNDYDTKNRSVLDIFKTDPSIGFYADGGYQWWYITAGESVFAEWIKKELGGGMDTEVSTLNIDRLVGNRIFKTSAFHYPHESGINFYMAVSDLVFTEREARSEGCWYEVQGV
jgi:hypothetical protein